MRTLLRVTSWVSILYVVMCHLFFNFLKINGLHKKLKYSEYIVYLELRSEVMRKKQKMFLGFAVIMMAILTMIGCATLIPPPVEFPSDFSGIWERVNMEYPHTLAITSKTIKASNQTSFWNIRSISGDVYTISNSNNTNLRGTIHLRLVGGNLEIIDAYDMSNASQWSGGENDWTGTWKRK